MDKPKFEDDSQTAPANPSRSNHDSPIPVSRLSPPMDLVDLAKEIAHADQMLATRTGAKLCVIADQIRSLQAEARKALREAQQDRLLHHADCRFKRTPGHIYHLYRRSDDSLIFMMVAPFEWRGPPPHAYVGSYRLQEDMSWLPVEKAGSTDDSREMVRHLLEIGKPGSSG